MTSSTVFTIDAPGTCVGVDCGALVPGDFTVTGTDSGKTGTAILHVIPEGIVSIVISPDGATIVAGGTQTYTALAWDGFDNHDVTSSTVFTIDGVGSCTDAACGSAIAGNYTVTGTLGLITDTATLHVTAAASGSHRDLPRLGALSPQEPPRPIPLRASTLMETPADR